MEKTLSGGRSSCSKLWSMDDGDLGELLEKKGTVKDIGVQPDSGNVGCSWTRPGQRR